MEQQPRPQSLAPEVLTLLIVTLVTIVAIVAIGTGKGNYNEYVVSLVVAVAAIGVGGPKAVRAYLNKKSS